MQCYYITYREIAIVPGCPSTIGLGVEGKAISHLSHCPLRLDPSADRRCQKCKHAKNAPSKPPSRTPRPGLVEHRMAGLLTCGSRLSPPSQPLRGQWRSGVALRLQLRGQSRTGRKKRRTVFPFSSLTEPSNSASPAVPDLSRRRSSGADLKHLGSAHFQVGLFQPV